MESCTFLTDDCIGIEPWFMLQYPSKQLLPCFTACCSSLRSPQFRACGTHSWNIKGSTLTWFLLLFHTQVFDHNHLHLNVLTVMMQLSAPCMTSFLALLHGCSFVAWKWSPRKDTLFVHHLVLESRKYSISIQSECLILIAGNRAGIFAVIRAIKTPSLGAKEDYSC